MRWLLLALLLVNLGLLAWHHQRPLEPPSPAAAPPEGRVSLLLLEEARRAAPDTGAAPAAPPPPSAPHDATPDSAPPVPPAAEAPSEPVPRPAPVGPEQAQDRTPPPAETPPPADAPPVPADAPGVPPARADLPADLEADPPPAPPPEQCYTVGPFEAGDPPIEALPARLRAAGVAVSPRQTEAREPRSYWVYLPPYPDIAAARAKLESLREAGVTDFIRVMRGPMTNAISLGLYSREDSARQRLEALAEQGIDALVEPRYDTRPLIWLDLRTALDPDAIPLPAELDLDPRPCGVPTGEPFPAPDEAPD